MFSSSDIDEYKIIKTREEQREREREREIGEREIGERERERDWRERDWRERERGRKRKKVRETESLTILRNYVMPC
jgi:hypothetical protein